MKTIIEAYTDLEQIVEDSCGSNSDAFTVVRKALTLVEAVLDDIEEGALLATSIEVNDYFIGDVLDPLRERLKRVSRGIVP